jgi:hypothetical protein
MKQYNLTDQLNGKEIRISCHSLDIHYYFKFHDNQIFMDSNHGEIFIDTLDNCCFRREEMLDVSEWYREYGINLVCHIVYKNLQDADVFEEIAEENKRMSIYLFDTEKEKTIASSTFYLRAHLWDD